MVGKVKACVFPYRRDIKVNLLKKRQMLRGLETISKWGGTPLKHSASKKARQKSGNHISKVQ